MMRLAKISFFLLLALPLAGQQATSTQSDLDRRIERQVRAYTEAPLAARILLGERTPSNFAGFDNFPVSIEANGVKKTLRFLIAKDNSKLVYMTEIDLKEDPYARNMSRIDLTGRPYRGAEKPAVTVVVYDDFQCPFCANMYVMLMNEVMTRYRDQVRIVMKDFPILDAHPWAMRAAVDGHCLAAQDLGAYWAYSDYIHTHQGDVNAKIRAAGATDLGALDALAKEFGEKHNLKPEPLTACLAAHDEAKVQSSLVEGRALGVSATPTMFVNGQEFEGILSQESIRLVLEQALKDAAAPKPGQ